MLLSSYLCSRLLMVHHNRKRVVVYCRENVSQTDDINLYENHRFNSKSPKCSPPAANQLPPEKGGGRPDFSGGGVGAGRGPPPPIGASISLDSESRPAAQPLGFL